MISKALEGIGIRSVSPGRFLTTNQKILRAVVLVGAGSLLAKLAATGKELTVAAWFGRGDALDAFLIAFLVPSMVINLIAGSFSAAVVPTYVQVREKQGREAAERLLSNVQTASFVLLAALSILLAAGARYYLPLLGSGFDSAKLLLTRRLLYVLLPFVVLNGTTLVWSSVLNAGERFALPALTPVVTPLVALLSLMVFGRQWGIFALAAGTVAGAGSESVLLKWALRLRGVRASFRWHGATPELRVVLQQFVPMVAGALLVTTSPIIDQSMAAMLKGGSVAALSYGNKIVAAISTLGAGALSTAVLPYFSRMAAARDWTGCRRTLRVYSLLVVVVTVPLTAALVAGSKPLVRLLYQRGAFRESDTLAVSAVQVFLALMIPFYAWSSMLVRLITSLKRSGLLAGAAVINASLNVILNVVLMKPLGVAGIALSTSLSTFAASLFLGFSVYLLLRGRETPGTS